MEMAVVMEWSPESLAFLENSTEKFHNRKPIQIIMVS